VTIRPSPAAVVSLRRAFTAGIRAAGLPEPANRYGGAKWTLVSGIGILGSVLYTSTTLSPDVAGGAEALRSDFNGFIIGMLLIFLFSGIGNPRRSSRCR
jgi:MFS transporter, NNP family, nitrate/nitrite transporter